MTLNARKAAMLRKRSALGHPSPSAGITRCNFPGVNRIINIDDENSHLLPEAHPIKTALEESDGKRQGYHEPAGPPDRKSSPRCVPYPYQGTKISTIQALLTRPLETGQRPDKTHTHQNQTGLGTLRKTQQRIAWQRFPRGGCHNAIEKNKGNGESDCAAENQAAIHREWGSVVGSTKGSEQSATI